MTAVVDEMPTAGTVALGRDDDGAVSRYVETRDRARAAWLGVREFRRVAVTASEITHGGGVLVRITADDAYVRVLGELAR